MEQFLCFVDKWSSAIQAIMVVVMVIVTTWYSVLTRRMAKIMSQEYGLNSKPYLTIDRIVNRNVTDLTPRNKTLQLQFRFTNVSKVAVMYHTEEAIIEGTNLKPDTVETVLFPGQDGWFRTNTYYADREIGNGNGIKASIRIVYWAAGVPEKKTTYTRHIELIPDFTRIEKEEITESS